jgi:hypothetical protein
MMSGCAHLERQAWCSLPISLHLFLPLPPHPNRRFASPMFVHDAQVKVDVLGPVHSETANTLRHLSEVRWQQGRRREAIELAQRALGESCAP